MVRKLGLMLVVSCLFLFLGNMFNGCAVRQNLPCPVPPEQIQKSQVDAKSAAADSEKAEKERAEYEKRLAEMEKRIAQLESEKAELQKELAKYKR